MKLGTVVAVCLLLASPGRVQGAALGAEPAGAKAVWASGLQDPHGMARDEKGNIWIAEFKGGRVSRFSPDGKKLGTLGEGLKGPAWVAASGATLYVSERKANRVLRAVDGKLEPLPQAIEEPLGVAVDQRSGRLFVVSHTTSKLWTGEQRKGSAALELFYAPDGAGARYGLRCAAVAADGAVYVTDETDGRILKLSAGGAAETWVAGLEDPSGIVIGPDGAVYVADEGAGRVVRIAADRKPVVVAEGFERPRGLLFLADGSLLVGDRANGTVYRVTLARH
jgi:sugar lactone lactonase YvrE